MRIFISHREVDAKIARALIDVLTVGIPINGDQILCTSAPGHKLRFGETIESQLKAEIQSKPVLIALLTRRALSSSWVTFELGAAWGLGVIIVPILGKNVAYSDVPAALKNYPGIGADQTPTDLRSSIAQALQQIRDHGVVGQTPNPAKASAAIDAFIDLLNSTPESEHQDPSPFGLINPACPNGYTLTKTAQGGVLYESATKPPHFACVACWSKDRKISQMQENGSKPTWATCLVCKGAYRLNLADPPVNWNEEYQSTDPDFG